MKNTVQAIRKKLKGKKVLLLPYSHMDWAWCFRRSWHEARYTLIFDETLELAESDPSFCFFMDAVCESLEDYLRIRPRALKRWRKLIKSGQFTLTAGHYANLRPTTAPEETYIRNIEEGRNVLAEWFPGFTARGFANVDTAIGHCQLPQVLRMAGYEYTLGGRPELLLEMEGKPKFFRWKGLDGSEIITCIQHYGFLYERLKAMSESSGNELEKIRRQFLTEISRHADIPANTLFVIISMDDGRPLRHHITDQPFDLHKAIRDWNQDEDSEMLISTPDQFLEMIRKDRKKLPVLSGEIDPADVGYNGPFGASALRHLRDRSAALLVEAEIYSAFASGTSLTWPAAELRQAWRRVLRAQTHAVQFLFNEDIDAMRLDLLNACKTAETIRSHALAELLPPALPQDTDTVSIISSRPHPCREIASIAIQRVDFEVGGYELRTPSGRRPVQQAVESCNPRRPGEWSLLVKADVPACGAASYKLHATPEASFAEQTERKPDCRISCGPWNLTWNDRRLCSIALKKDRIRASSFTSILEPMLLECEHIGWRTTKIQTNPKRTDFSSLNQIESGPLRWRFQRQGLIRNHDIFQDIFLYANGRLDVDTEINCGPDTAYFGLGMPCGKKAELRASIPFGVEKRDLSAIQYSRETNRGRSIERLIPGMFYARDWVQCTDTSQRYGLAVLDGDRYWFKPPRRSGLVHLLLRITRPYREGWERYSQMAHPGCARFRHALVLGKDAKSVSTLSQIADQARFPMRVQYTAPEKELSEQLSIHPANLRMLCCRKVGSATEIRVVESGGRTSRGVLRLAQKPRSVRLTDLNGNDLKNKARIKGNEIHFPVSKWQLRNIRITQ